MSLGQPHGRDPAPPVGEHGGQRVPGTGRGRGVGRQPGRAEPERGSGHLHHGVIGGIRHAGRDEEQAVLILVGADEQVDAPAMPGSDAVDGPGGQDLPVHHRFEGHHVGGDLTPPGWVGLDGDISGQLFLGADQLVCGDGSEAFQGGGHASG